MVSLLPSLIPPAEFFPPSPRAFQLLFNIFRSFSLLSLLQWTPLGDRQAMGKTSSTSRLNLPGRYAWAVAEVIGPVNLLFILYTLPSKLKPAPASDSSLLGTGLSLQMEIMGGLYILHYVNRALLTPLYLAPSISPIHPLVSAMMATFQFINSSNLACWLVYTSVAVDFKETPVLSIGAVIGLALFLAGFVGNIRADATLFELRRGAAKRKAKSEGKAQITYDKVYVIPPAQGLFAHILYPHYAFEWLEWTGFYILGASWGLGWGYESAALWFVIVEIATMLPRAVAGRQWYEQRFGKRAVGGRVGAIPWLNL